jgi:hypothetical protein
VKTYLNQLKSVDFWKIQSSAIIPLIIGLALTKSLRVRGWLAILIYMLTADTTRWLMSVAATSADENRELDLPDFKKVDKKFHLDVPKLPAKITYEIVHQTVGRVRFHVPQIAQDTAYAQRLENLLKADANVKNVRVNSQAASVTIAYSNPEFNLKHWVQLMELALQTHPHSISIIS